MKNVFCCISIYRLYSSACQSKFLICCHSHSLTYKAEADFGLSDCSTASHQTEDEHHHADADNDSSWDQRVLVLDEIVKVVIALDHIGADVGQRRSCSLQRKRKKQLNMKIMLHFHY